MTPPLHLLKHAAFTVATTLSLIAPAAAAPDLSLNGDTLMWRLEPPGGGEPSYIVGTIHLADQRLEPSLERALERLHDVGALVVETDLSDAGMAEVVQSMLLGDGRTLRDIIGEESFARAVEIAEAYGASASDLLPFAPWAISMMFSVPADQSQMAATGAVFDDRLVEAAEAWALPVGTLEPIQEQIAALSDYTEAEQVAMLSSVIEMHPLLDEAVEGMLAAYIADDLAGIVTAAMEQYPADDPLVDRFLDRLIIERNHRMAERVIPMLEERPHLVAIGALHLPGDEGVLNLLAEQGWTVVPAEL